MEEQTTAWRPWLEMLPAAAVGIDERVAKALQYEPAIRMCEELRRSRAAVVAAATDSAAVSCSALEYERCISLAATRAFLVPLPDGSQCHALVPGADLFNHAALEESCAEWSLSATAKNPVMAFRVHARRDVNVGEELTLCYDALRSNDDFAVVYGFVPSTNAFDDVDLFVDAAHAIAWHAAAYGSSTEAATATAMALLAPARASDDEARPGAVDAQEDEEAMVAPALADRIRRDGVSSHRSAPLWVTASAADPRLLDAFEALCATSEDAPTDDGETDDARAARHARAALLQRCQEVLAAFETSLEDDLHAIDEANAVQGPDAIPFPNAAIPLDSAPPAGEGAADDSSVVPSASAAAASTEMSPQFANVALRYRASKKLVLRAVAERLRTGRLQRAERGGAAEGVDPSLLQVQTPAGWAGAVVTLEGRL